MDLITVFEGLINLGTIVHSPENAKYRVYSRHSHLDRIALVQTDKLRPILWAKWAEVS